MHSCMQKYASQHTELFTPQFHFILKTHICKHGPRKGTREVAFTQRHRHTYMNISVWFKTCKATAAHPPPHKAWIAVLEQAINDRERQGMREVRGHEGEYRRQSRVAALTAQGEQRRRVRLQYNTPSFLRKVVVLSCCCWWCYAGRVYFLELFQVSDHVFIQCFMI